MSSHLRVVPPPRGTPAGELAAAEARECRLLIEISKLHETIGFMRAACERALKDCMHDGSIQAVALKNAIEKARETL